MARALLLLLLLPPQDTIPPPARSAPAILETSCVRCHGPRQPKGGLDLSTREALLRGGDSGPAILPGKPKESLLYKVVARLEEPFMPKKAERLPPDAVEAIAAWIEAGVPYDRPLASRAAEEPHWAFRPLGKPQGLSIDEMLGRALRARGLAMNPPAPRRVLARRLAFDLVGLPPTPEEVDAFERDPAPDATERLVDRLLASPRHGERWARHWLDVARYADSEGYRFDNDRKHSWPYRDFVIRALNDDLPFDTFIRWQLAGDELAPGHPEAWAATGFLTCGPLQEKQASDSKKNQERNRYDELDDMLSTTGSAFLGLTLGCARCHDHKFDPIPQREYYRLIAAFIGTRREDRHLASREAVAAFRASEAELARAAEPVRARLREIEDARRPPLADRKIGALPIRDEDKEILRDRKPSQRQKELRTLYARELAVSDDELRAAMSEAERTAWDAAREELRALEARRPTAPPQAHVIADVSARPARSFLLARGEVDQKREELPLGFLSALGSPEPPAAPRPAGAASSFQRAALAAWMTDVERGAGRLAARVIVNRVWQHHFGRGLVATPNDFGSQGDLPSHPELLEELAASFVAGGWRLKPLHRRIVLSAAYLQDGRADAAKVAADPENRLLGRRTPRRLEAEALRDSILAVSGRLNLRIGGPGVKVPIPAELIITRTEGEHHYPRDVQDGPEVWRRSVYTFIKRSVPHPMTELFDAPAASGSCGQRITTTVAPQALLLLHDPFVRARARDFAGRLAAEGATAEERVDRAYRLALGRPPSGTERIRAMAFLRDQAARRGGDAAAALADFGQVLFGLNEFIYVD